jgi:penicillin amidase
MFDESFSDELSDKRNLAVRWSAHDPSNEGMTFFRLNRAKNYDDYAEAIKTFQCPGQNFVFASKAGDIAIWQQGRFPARWDRQGLYVMPGQDSSYMWQGFIPQAENPHSKNPARGFLESANQRPADSTYPYFIPGSYITARAITIENNLAAKDSLTPDDMMKLQNNYFNTTAEDVRPILLKYVEEDKLNAKEKEYLDIIKKWDLMASPDSKGQTVYTNWWFMLKFFVLKEFRNGLNLEDIKKRIPNIETQTVMELLKKDTSLLFYYKAGKLINENNKVTASLRMISAVLDSLSKTHNGLEWYKYDKPGIYHLLDKSKKDLLPFDRPNLHTGGAGDIVNAINGSHGPSWRMIVQLTSTTDAYGLYPGGQSGNPGSKYYDNFIDYWVEGKYYKLWFMHDADKTDKNVKWTMKFSNSQ